jgi:hypothetical protein
MKGIELIPFIPFIPVNNYLQNPTRKTKFRHRHVPAFELELLRSHPVHLVRVGASNIILKSPSIFSGVTRIVCRLPCANDR